MLECPRCGARMISRKNRDTGQRFWGCSNYPACKGTRNTDGEAPRDTVPDARDEEAERESGTPSDRQRANDRRRWE